MEIIVTEMQRETDRQHPSIVHHDISFKMMFDSYEFNCSIKTPLFHEFKDYSLEGVEKELKTLIKEAAKE